MDLPEDDDLHAQFCRELATLRLLSGGPRRAALEQAVRRLREGADIDEVIAGLDVTLIGPLLVREGKVDTPTAVGAPGPPVRGAYLCPVGACRRVERRRAGEGPPECLVHERVLSFVPDA
ncbi:hypothetical protein ACIQ6Y_08370 [Streptomyces sp. NPDC096205]|uniref:hypothetical protein n=1 Tax=Streptomyces sp. NPDC096205 TaxID=3366081 RepID=UPI0037F3B4F2